jgi:hypothetical protein
MNDSMQDKQSRTANETYSTDARKSYKSGTSFAGLGFILTILGRLFYSLPGYISYLAICMLVAGIPLFFFGCHRIAKGKGYHDAWALLGLLSLIGLIILFLIPNRIENK